MNKKMILLGLIFLLIAFFAGSVFASEFELKWYQSNSMQHPWCVVGQKICDEINKETDGRIEITQYPSGALGTQSEALNMLRTGSLAFLTSGPSILASFFPQVQLFSLPYLFNDKDHAHKTFKEDWVDEIFNDIILKKSNVRTIAYWYYGVRTLTTTDTPVYTPADLKGCKVRCPDLPLWKDIIASLGASPTPVSFSELYMALQTGLVDGQENPLTTIYDMKFYEVQNYLIFTNQSVHMGSVHVSEPIWKKISEKDRKIILEVFDRNNPLIDEKIDELGLQYLDVMKDKGLKTIEPDIEAFKKHAKEYIWERYGEKWGEYILKINPSYNQ